MSDKLCICGHYYSEHFDEGSRACAYCPCSSFHSMHNAVVAQNYNLADEHDKYQEDREREANE